MKISVAWIFDHIDSDWKKYNIDDLVSKFNKTTAEVEGVYKVGLNLKDFSFVEVVDIGSKKITVFSSEWDKKFELPFRSDAKKSNIFLMKKTKDNFFWSKLVDLHCEKEGFVPSLSVSKDLISGDWKKSFDSEDYILEVDNKSITHRPDMWGHRGFAREIAAMFDLPFISLKNFIAKKTILKSDKDFKSTKDFSISVSLKDQSVGKRFAGFYLKNVENKSSTFDMAYRLMITGNRPINYIVDSTNYVMLDLSQPMHAFDAKSLKSVEARLAHSGEKLTLLDGKEIELTEEDYIITDGNKPISLAGIMGGENSGISENTKSIFLESACFDATTIRKTSARVKVRTESSARFEKTLDPNQNIDAILRFLKLLNEENIEFKSAKEIVSIGKVYKPLNINVTHDFICKRLGVDVPLDFVESTLKKIEFDVIKVGDKNIIGYDITIPTFRSTKDVTIVEDIIEELGRFFGYDNIPQELPSRMLASFSLNSVMRLRKVKNVLSRSLRMREIYNYALYDESFLKTIKFTPSNSVLLQNPVSENSFRLVGSLIPNLLKNVSQNLNYEKIRFFESARIWNLLNNKTIVEQKTLSGIIFDRKKKVDFYESKSLLERLFESLEMKIVWRKANNKKTSSLFSEHQTAELFLNKESIGFAGIIDDLCLSHLGEGFAFGFELNLDLLMMYEPEMKKYKAVSKYPSVNRDISILLPLSVTVDDVVATIESADSRVQDVVLIDLFQKKDWNDKKSLTVRFEIQDKTKTLTNNEADEVFSEIKKKVEKLGATIR